MTETYRLPHPIWCAGCGHFGVQAALARALTEVGAAPHEVLVLAGIGCSGTIQNNLGTYGYHALHGRVLPTAAGVALANPRLTVIAAGGDGDGYAIGAGHLVHTFRRNPSLLYVVMNNGTYGLTKGQPSPTAPALGDTPQETLDAIMLGLSLPGSTFLARGFSRWYDQMEHLLVTGLDHARSGRGFAFVEVLSPCVTYHDLYAIWEAGLHDLDAEEGYDPSDRAGAFARCVGLSEIGRMPVGLVYRGGPPAVVPDPGPANVEVSGHAPAYREIAAAYLV
jgi:2-oxoglutarate ferredoxin oxidoreductase subunit beta